MSDDTAVVIETLRDVAKHPGMYGLDGSYEHFCIFVTGYDVGSRGELLRGFNGWFSARLGRHSNFVWWAQIDAADPAVLPAVTPDGGKRWNPKVAATIELIAEFRDSL